MIETKFPKLNWDTVCEQNVGHTSQEWGVKKNANKIIAYTVIWDKSRV